MTKFKNLWTESKNKKYYKEFFQYNTMIQNSQMYKKGGIFNLFSKNNVDNFPEENNDYLTLLSQAKRNLEELEKNNTLNIHLPHGQLSSIISVGSNISTNSDRKLIQINGMKSFVMDFHRHLNDIRKQTLNDTLKSELAKYEKLVNEYFAFIDRNSL